MNHKCNATTIVQVTDVTQFLRSPPPPPSLIFFFLLLSQLSRRTSRGNACYAGYHTVSPGGGGRGEVRVGVLGLIFARYVPLASQSPYSIIIYSVANYRPSLLGKCNFRNSSLVNFPLCIYPSNPYK